MLIQHSTKMGFVRAKRMLALLLLALSVALAGCIEDSDSGDSESLIGENSGPDTSGSVTVSWQAPESREDGSDFRAADVSHYEVAYGTESGDLTESVTDVKEPSVYINTLQSGETYYFAVRVFDHDGLASQYSEEVSTVVN